ncbi:MAG: tRNA-binding protein [Bacteroidales bacterium]|nr:tRNA-binding protein [Bacteroidales bacterium]
MQITVEDFDRVDVRIGTIVAVDINKKARKPAYKLTVDLGEELGIKTSSAQITDLYAPEDLVGRQAVFCVNLVPMHIGSVRSEVRILGSESEGGVVLLQPSMAVKNGDRVF